MTLDSSNFDYFVPVYDAIPKEWEDARPFVVEQLKRISNAVNSREIGFFLDQEVLSGKQFIPVPAMEDLNRSADSQQTRTVLRKVINVSPLILGVNTFAHGIIFDANFTLIDLWIAGTNSVTLTARVISGNDVIMNAINLVITSPQAFDRAFAFVEYTQEI